jgi:hypothetical protein
MSVEFPGNWFFGLSRALKMRLKNGVNTLLWHEKSASWLRCFSALDSPL